MPSLLRKLFKTIKRPATKDDASSKSIKDEEREVVVLSDKEKLDAVDQKGSGHGLQSRDSEKKKKKRFGLPSATHSEKATPASSSSQTSGPESQPGSGFSSPLGVNATTREQLEGYEWRKLEERTPNLRRLGLDDCLSLVLACSQELEKRGLSTLGIMRPFRPDSDPALIVHLIELFSVDKASKVIEAAGRRPTSANAARPLSLHTKGTINPAFFGALSSAKPQTIATLLRWAIRHLKVPRRNTSGSSGPTSPNSPTSSPSGKGGTGMRWFQSFLAAEAANKYPKTAYSEIFLPSIPAANGELITCLLSLATTLSADDVTIGVRCVRSWAFWVFGAQARDFVPTGTLKELGWADRPTNEGFWDDVGISGIRSEYNKVANAMERLWIAYIRDLSAQQRSNVPRALAEKTMTVYPLSDRTIARRIKVLWVRTRSEIAENYGNEDEESSQTSDADLHQKRTPAQTIENALRASVMLASPSRDGSEVLAREYMKSLVHQRDQISQDDILPSLDNGLFTKESARVTQLLAHRDNSKLPVLERIESRTTRIGSHFDGRQRFRSTTMPSNNSAWTQSRAYRGERSETPSGAPIAERFKRLTSRGVLIDHDGSEPYSPPLSELGLSRSESRSGTSTLGKQAGSSNHRSSSRQSFITLISPRPTSAFSQARSPRSIETTPFDVDKFLSDGFGALNVETEALKLGRQTRSSERLTGPPSDNDLSGRHADDDRTSQYTRTNRGRQFSPVGSGPERPFSTWAVKAGSHDRSLPKRPSTALGGERSVLEKPKSIVPSIPSNRDLLQSSSPAPCVILSASIETFDVAFIDFWLDSVQDEVCPWGNVGMLQLKKAVVDRLVEGSGGDGVDWLLVEEICIPKGASPTPSIRSDHVHANDRDLYDDMQDGSEEAKPSFLANLTTRASSFFETAAAAAAVTVTTTGPREQVTGPGKDGLSTPAIQPVSRDYSIEEQQEQPSASRATPSMAPPAITKPAKGPATNATTTARSISVLGLGNSLASWWSSGDTQTRNGQKGSTEVVKSSSETQSNGTTTPIRPRTHSRLGSYAPDPPTPGPLQTPEMQRVKVDAGTKISKDDDDDERGVERRQREGSLGSLGSPLSGGQEVVSGQEQRRSSSQVKSSRTMSPFGWRRGHGPTLSTSSSSSTGHSKRENSLSSLPSRTGHKVSTLNTVRKRAPVETDSDDEEFPMRPASRASYRPVAEPKSLFGEKALAAPSTDHGRSLSTSSSTTATPSKSRTGLDSLSEDGPMLPSRTTSRLAMINPKTFPFRRKRSKDKGGSPLGPGRSTSTSRESSSRPLSSSSSVSFSRSQDSHGSSESGT